MSDPKMVKEIMAAVTIPVMAKARIGHFVECQVRPPSPSPYHTPPTLPVTALFSVAQPYLSYLLLPYLSNLSRTKYQG